MALVIFLSAFLSFANNCPSEKELPSLPVHDQDGLGTCASNTAALMMQHNLVLVESPSYFQLSLTYSGNHRDSFFFTNDKGEEKVFNWGADVCSVINQAKKSGFCDHSVFGFDSVGEADPRFEQQEFLVELAQFLDGRVENLRNLQGKLLDPSTQTRYRQSLASHFLERSKICSISFSKFLATRSLERFIRWLKEKIPTVPSRDRSRYQAILSGFTEKDGSPGESALVMYEYYIKAQAQPLLAAQENGLSELSGMILPDEKKFAENYAQALGLSGFSFDFPYSNFFQSDLDAFSICKDNDLVSGLIVATGAHACADSNLLSHTDAEAFKGADDVIQGILNYVKPGVDPQAGIVNLISPACAVQMNSRAESSMKCENRDINSMNTSKSASIEIQEELCKNRATGLWICTGFWKSETVIDSQFCENDVEGVTNHGRHGVTIIGRRMVEGKLQFKVQNSWGATCPFLQNPSKAVPVALKNLVECEMDDESLPTGRMWIDESLLLNNSYQYSVMP